jgi:mitofusin
LCSSRSSTDPTSPSAVGLAVFIVIDLPRAVPRNIGRKLQSSLSSPLTSSPTSPPTSFSTAHSDRIARETRKVLRLAGWDLRERFRSALEKSANERKEVEATVDKAEHALTWLGDFLVKVVDEDDRVEALVL